MKKKTRLTPRPRGRVLVGASLAMALTGAACDSDDDESTGATDIAPMPNPTNGSTTDIAPMPDPSETSTTDIAPMPNPTQGSSSDSGGSGSGSSGSGSSGGSSGSGSTGSGSTDDGSTTVIPPMPPPTSG